MTLIQAVMTKNWVALASDRRVTAKTYTGTGWRIITQEDSDLKSFVIDCQWIMGFTGVARMPPDRQRMEDWLADIYNNLPSKNGKFDVLATRFSAHLQATGRSDQEQTFLAVGVNEEVSATASPEIVVISNRFRDRLRDRQQLIVEHYPLGDKPHMYIASVEPSPEILELTLARLTSLAELPSSDPLFLCNTLRDAQLRIAEASNGYVGESMLFTFVPRSAFPLVKMPDITAFGQKDFDPWLYMKEHEYSVLIDGEGGFAKTQYLPARFGVGYQINAVTFETFTQPL